MNSPKKSPEKQWEHLVAAARSETPPILDLRRGVRETLAREAATAQPEDPWQVILHLFRGVRGVLLFAGGGTFMAGLILLSLFLAPAPERFQPYPSNQETPPATESSTLDPAEPLDSIYTYLETGDWTDLLELPTET
jgi:hypothetical protein